MRSLIIRLFILLGLFFPALAAAVTPMVGRKTMLQALVCGMRGTMKRLAGTLGLRYEYPQARSGRLLARKPWSAPNCSMPTNSLYISAYRLFLYPGGRFKT